MKRQYLVEIKMQVVVESYDDIEDVGENVYAQCAELAFSDDHLLYLEVTPCPLPPPHSSGSPDHGDLPAHQT